MAPQILLVQPDVPDLEDLRVSATGDEEQVPESRESWWEEEVHAKENASIYLFLPFPPAVLRLYWEFPGVSWLGFDILSAVVWVQSLGWDTWDVE